MENESENLEDIPEDKYQMEESKIKKYQMKEYQTEKSQVEGYQMEEYQTEESQIEGYQMEESQAEEYQIEEFRIEKYRIEGKIGKGGSGIVYKARDERLGSTVAVKEFHDGNKYARKEVELLKKLKHPALPNILDYIVVEEKKYLVMEYIEGVTLECYVKKFGPIGQKQALAWAGELVQVLYYLHERGEPIIYRDMKPSNVMINDKGEVKLIDFGSAYFKYEEGEERICAGTYGYAAPEQFGRSAGTVVDERSDVYGLGAILHYMLTGSDPSQPPFLIQPLRFYNAALSPGLEKVIRKATEKEREKRYQSIAQMEEALKKQNGADKRRKWMYAIAGVIYYLLLLTAGSIFWRQWELYRRYGGERFIGNEWKAAVTAGAIVSLCLIKTVFGCRRAGPCKKVRQIKAVYLSSKKNRGLMAVFCIAMASFLLAAPCMASGKEDVFPVIVRNEKGQKLIIRYDTVYSPSGDMKLEVPADSFKGGKEYELTLICTELDTMEERSRTFYLKFPAP
ncbi:serine/threonine protein kinase [Kineothrix alysoides]|uniref:Serine/threonine protein kinase n=1 Tax=Kineothrix alysoides TaxID=1469948 RepID=A0A4R1QVC1_9FIRM|nr:serine/threonine-protein kinase [Kineothrix alysoides]TCL56525.1 serine/threonine protein kinase [Kineothrix alysoides]